MSHTSPVPSTHSSRALRRRRVVGRTSTVALAALALGACGGSDGPTSAGGGLDAARVTSATGDLTAVVQQPVLQVLQQYGFGGPAAARLPGGLRTRTVARQDMQGTATVGPRLLAAIVGGSAGSAPRPAFARALLSSDEAMIPDAVRGRVYVWQDGRLTHDAARTGAPADGVRLVVRALDGQGRPTGDVVGHVDLRDSSSATAQVLSVVVLAGTGTSERVAYRGRVSQTETGNASVSTLGGTATDGTRAVSFTLTETTGGSAGASGVTRWTLEAPGLSVDGEERTPTSAADQQVQTVRVAGRVLRFTQGAERQPDGSWETASQIAVTLDGRPYATFDPAATGSVWRDPGGGALAPEQAEVLRRVTSAVEWALPVAFLPLLGVFWVFAITFGL